MAFAIDLLKSSSLLEETSLKRSDVLSAIVTVEASKITTVTTISFQAMGNRNLIKSTSVAIIFLEQNFQDNIILIKIKLSDYMCGKQLSPTKSWELYLQAGLTNYIGAFLLTVLGVYGSITFLGESNATVDGIQKGPVLAYLDRSNNALERKPVKRLIWNPVHKGEALYAGDTIRTNQLSYGTIKFVDSGIKINLEQDSLIELKKAGGRPSLNLINGGLLVDTQEANTKSGSKTVTPTITLGKSKVELSKKAY